MLGHDLEMACAKFARAPDNCVKDYRVFLEFTIGDLLENHACTFN